MADKKHAKSRQYYTKSFCRFGKIPQPVMWPAPPHTLEKNRDRK